jgi:hypothetical protein
MLPVSLDCQFLIAPTVFFVVEFCFVCPRLMSFVSHVASVSGLSILRFFSTVYYPLTEYVDNILATAFLLVN